MSANNNAGSSQNKQPAPEPSGGGFRAQANMTVQPPRVEDLQKSYATIVSNDANPSGWYGSMGTLHLLSLSLGVIVVYIIDCRRD